MLATLIMCGLFGVPTFHLEWARWLERSPLNMFYMIQESLRQFEEELQSPDTWIPHAESGARLAQNGELQKQWMIHPLFLGETELARGAFAEEDKVGISFGGGHFKAWYSITLDQENSRDGINVWEVVYESERKVSRRTLGFIALPTDDKFTHEELLHFFDQWMTRGRFIRGVPAEYSPNMRLLGAYDRFIAAYWAELSGLPPREASWFYRGLLRSYQGNHLHWETSFTEFVANRPETVNYRMLSLFHRATGYHDKAVETLGEMFTIHPDELPHAMDYETLKVGLRYSGASAVKRICDEVLPRLSGEQKDEFEALRHAAEAIREGRPVDFVLPSNPLPADYRDLDTDWLYEGCYLNNERAPPRWY